MYLLRFVLLLPMMFAEPLMAYWETPVTITSYANYAINPSVAVNATGYTMAAWSEYDGHHFRIRAATKTAGSAWSNSIDLSNTCVEVSSPFVAMNAEGDAIVVWEEYNGFTSKINIKMRTFGGSWSPSITLSDPKVSAANPKACIDALGNIVVVWERYDGEGVGIQALRRTYYGAWDTPEDISYAREKAYQPQIASNAIGNVVIVWTGFDGTNLYTEASTLQSTGGWSLPDYISEEGYDAMNPQVMLHASGVAVAIWTGYDGNNFVTKGSILTPGEGWSSPTYISAPGQDAYHPHLGIDLLGNGVAVWTRNDGNNFVVESASLFENYSATPGSYVWTDPVTISEAGEDTSSPKVTMDQNGNAIAVWTRLKGTNFVLQSATLPFGCSWSVPETISDPTLDAITPSIAMDAVGNAIILWAENYNHYVIQSVEGNGFF